LHTFGGRDLGTRSYLSTTDDAQDVINATFNGEAKILSVNKSQNRVYVEYKGVKGFYNDNGVPKETNKFLIKGTGTSTVVPIHQSTSKFR
jgi:hypothetical protein